MSISLHTRHYTALQLTQGVRLSIPHCYYNSNVAVAYRVCALNRRWKEVLFGGGAKVLSFTCKLCMKLRDVPT